MSAPEHIGSLLDRRGVNGGPFWSRDDGDIHAPSGFSTIDVLTVLGDLGARVDDAAIEAAAEFVFGYQADDGSFRYGAKSSKLPCFAGRITAALCRVGVTEDDDRLCAAFDWMLDHVWDDGGWRCATVKLGKSPETDASNPGSTLYVLDALRFRPGTDRGVTDAAVETLLHHWETRLPLGPCTFGLGSRFLRVEYPCLRYNLLFYVDVLSHYEAARNDPRFDDALAELASHVVDGELVVDTPHRAWRGFDFARPGTPSSLATARWRSIEANMAA